MATNQRTRAQNSRLKHAVTKCVSPIMRTIMRSSLPAVLLLSAITFTTLPGLAQAEPNFFEQRTIEARALETFKRVISLWQEEVYFELYAAGMISSRGRITQEDFAQRMVELEWVPKGRLNPKYIKADFHFRTMVYVTARVPYGNKFNTDRTFTREQTFIMVEEDGQWRIDLINLIRAPYS